MKVSYSLILKGSSVISLWFSLTIRRGKSGGQLRVNGN